MILSFLTAGVKNAKSAQLIFGKLSLSGGEDPDFGSTGLEYYSVRRICVTADITISQR